MNYLIVLNDHPYESERNYNGLRLATALASDESNVVRLFLIGEAVFSAVGGQAVPELSAGRSPAVAGSGGRSFSAPC